MGTREQLGRGRDCYFNYDDFWQQFRAERLVSGFYRLDPLAPERPLEEIKAKYRPRTLRKRQVRHAVETAFQEQFTAAREETAQAGPRPRP